MDVFRASDYRSFMQNWIQLDKSRGSRTRLARAAQCSPSWLTRVLAEEVHLTPDQAMGISLHMQLSEDETEYFLLLVDWERAATPLLQTRLQKKLNALKKQSRQLRSSIKDTDSVSDQDLVMYYSTWIYGAVHVACMIKPLTSEEIAQRIGTSHSRVAAALKDLRAMELVSVKGNQFSATSKSIHLPADHPHAQISHVIWRSRVIQFLQEGSGDGLHYSAIHCLAKQDVDTIHGILKSAIIKSRDLISQSPSETLAILCLDWFAL